MRSTIRKLMGKPKHGALLVFGCAWLGVLGLLHDRYQLTVVQGVSMRPSLMTGDLLLVRKHAYDRMDPVRGEMVVAKYEGGLIVKRVVGLPGEEVEVKDGGLFIRDRRVVENHAIWTGPVNIQNGRLFEGKFAVLGDNRAISASQVVHAIVTKEQILGKVVCIIHLSSRRTREGPNED